MSIIFGSLLFVYILFDTLIMPAYTRHGQAIRVPDLTSLIYEDAREVLDRLDLKIFEEAKKFDSNNEFPIGVVMTQNPAPGSTVKKGRRIYVIVSKGEPRVEMPQLIGRSERNAIFTIENLGLTLGEIRYESSNDSGDFHIGKVIAQSIPADREVRIGTPVDLIVIAKPDQFTVPNVIGCSLREARKIIFEAGLMVGAIYYQDDLELLPETVVDQFPRIEEKVIRGDTLQLWVSKLPDK